jgi:hypothetical protein
MDWLTEHADSEEDGRYITIEQVEILDRLSIPMALNSHIPVTYRHRRKLEFLLSLQRKERPGD